MLPIDMTALLFGIQRGVGTEHHITSIALVDYLGMMAKESSLGWPGVGAEFVIAKKCETSRSVQARRRISC